MSEQVAAAGCNSVAPQSHASSWLQHGMGSLYSFNWVSFQTPMKSKHFLTGGFTGKCQNSFDCFFPPTSIVRVMRVYLWDSHHKTWSKGAGVSNKDIKLSEVL